MKPSQPLQPLTPYQKTVLEMSLDGKPLGIIAFELGTTTNSISATRVEIRRKGHYLPLVRSGQPAVEVEKPEKAMPKYEHFSDLTPFQKIVLAMTLKDESRHIIADVLHTTPRAVTNSRGIIRAKGYDLPKSKYDNTWRPVTTRFFAEATMPSGGTVSVAGESKEAVDAHLAAMLEVGP